MILAAGLDIFRTTFTTFFTAINEWWFQVSDWSLCQLCLWKHTSRSVLCNKHRFRWLLCLLPDGIVLNWHLSMDMSIEGLILRQLDNVNIVEPILLPEDALLLCRRLQLFCTTSSMRVRSIHISNRSSMRCCHSAHHSLCRHSNLTCWNVSLKSLVWFGECDCIIWICTAIAHACIDHRVADDQNFRRLRSDATRLLSLLLVLLASTIEG